MREYASCAGANAVISTCRSCRKWWYFGSESLRSSSSWKAKSDTQAKWVSSCKLVPHWSRSAIYPLTKECHFIASLLFLSLPFPSSSSSSSSSFSSYFNFYTADGTIAKNTSYLRLCGHRTFHIMPQLGYQEWGEKVCNQSHTKLQIHLLCQIRESLCTNDSAVDRMAVTQTMDGRMDGWIILVSALLVLLVLDVLFSDLLSFIPLLTFSLLSFSLSPRNSLMLLSILFLRTSVRFVSPSSPSRSDSIDSCDSYFIYLSPLKSLFSTGTTYPCFLPLL